MNPIRAVQTNDVVPLLLSSQRSNLRDLRMKDNFNNTFLSKCPSEPLLRKGIATKLTKRCESIVRYLINQNVRQS